mgnify:CR=1 FL=1
MQHIDCRGLACPQPVIRCREAVGSGADALAVQVDNAAARENNDAPHVLEVVDEVIDKIFSNRDGKKMTREEKLDLMRVMESRGIFLTKGAIEKVAEKMGVSKVTVYSYLDELKNRGETGPARDPLL